MKKAIDHTLIVLEKADDWMTKEELTAEVKTVFPKVNMWDVWKKLNNLAHIGYISNRGYRYYPPNELTNKVQECIDKGDNW